MQKLNITIVMGYRRNEREIKKKSLETNENGKQHTQKLWDAAKAVLR